MSDNNIELEANQYYLTVSGYVEHCVKQYKMKLSDKDKNGLSPEEIAEQEAALKEAAKEHGELKISFQKMFDAMCDSIETDGIPSFKLYVDSLIKLYKDKPDWKRETKSVLVSSKSLKLFRKFREKLLELYPVLDAVNRVFPIDDYPELSLNPQAALYGSEVNMPNKGSAKKTPLKNDEIQSVVDVLQKVESNERLGTWLIEIVIFDPIKMDELFRKVFVPERNSLKQWVYDKINTNNIYMSALQDALFKESRYIKILDGFVKSRAFERERKDLVDRINCLEKDLASEKQEHEERRLKQLEIIREKDSENVSLKDQLVLFEKCKNQLDSYIEKYQAQLDINERLTIENARRITEIEDEYRQLQTEETENVEKLEELQSQYSALQADYGLKNSELTRLKDLASQKEEAVRIELLRELVTGISEQFYYLNMFYMELKETGKLQPDSIEIYGDTLNIIDQIFEKMGIERIGDLDEPVEYDASIHVSTDSKIAKGEKAVVRGYGWKILNDVYIKAPVEKGI